MYNDGVLILSATFYETKGTKDATYRFVPTLLAPEIQDEFENVVFYNPLRILAILYNLSKKMKTECHRVFHLEFSRVTRFLLRAVTLEISPIFLHGIPYILFFSVSVLL